MLGDRLAHALPSALVAMSCAAAVLHADRSPAAAPAVAAPAREASAGVVALLGGLRERERIAGWDVLGVSGPLEGEARIDLARDGLRFSIMVTRLGARPENPYVQTDRYAIHYGHAHPAGATVPDNAVRATAHAIARRIRATEAEVPVPAGM
jgi:hypothetical protein